MNTETGSSEPVFCFRPVRFVIEFQYMLRSRTMIHFTILIGLGLAGVIVARNYSGFQAFLQTINLKHTFQDECLSADCSDASQADASDSLDSDDYPEPAKTSSPDTKAKVDASAKKQ